MKSIKSKIPAEIYEILEKEGITELRPSQKKAVEAGLFENKNLLVCTPTASGKCMEYNSRILMGDGSLVKIGEIYDKKPKKDLFVLSLDENDLKIKNKKASKIHKIYHNKPLLKVKTFLGNEINVTPEHPFLAKRGSKLEWVRADNLKKGEFIIVPRLTKTSPKKYEFSKEDMLSSFSSCYVDNRLVETVVKKIKKSYREIAHLIEVDEKDLYRWRKRTNIPIKKIMSLSKITDYDILNKIDYASDINGMSILKLPSEVNEDIARLLGLVIADGSVHYKKSAFISFTNTNKNLRKEFQKICKREFNINTKTRLYKGKSPQEIAYSKVFTELIIYFGIPSGKKSDKVKVPYFILTQPNHIIASFLSGLFDCDGSVYDKGIEYSTDSKELIFEVQNLLLRFGIVSIIKSRFFAEKERYRLFIYRKQNLQLFKENIKLKNEKKYARLNILLKKKKESTNIDVIPFINEDFINLRKELNLNPMKMPASFESYVYGWRKNISYFNLKKFASKYLRNKKDKISKKLKIFANSNVYFDTVLNIRKTEPVKYVYDLTVPETSNFIAENIIVHNTLIAELAGLKSIIEGKGKVIYIVPLKALAAEKFKDFKRKYGNLIKIALSIGDIDSSDDYLIDYDFIICTAEKLDSLIRHNAVWLKYVRTVVIDEVHLINDVSRGPTLEIIITILKEILKNVQLIALSATIGNPVELANWIDANLVIDDWRPVKLKKGIYLDGEIEFYD